MESSGGDVVCAGGSDGSQTGRAWAAEGAAVSRGRENVMCHGHPLED